MKSVVKFALLLGSMVTINQANADTTCPVNQISEIALLDGGNATGTVTVTGNLPQYTKGNRYFACANNTITLKAESTSTAQFVSWINIACVNGKPTDTTCQMRVNPGRSTVGVNFSYVSSQSLNIGFAGSGTGTVVSIDQIGGQFVSCRSACDVSISPNYAKSNTGTLIATPGPGSVFAGWSGVCGGTGACPVKIDQKKSVTATFVKVPTPTPTPAPAPSLPRRYGLSVNATANPVVYVDGMTSTCAPRPPYTSGQVCPVYIGNVGTQVTLQVLPQTPVVKPIKFSGLPCTAVPLRTAPNNGIIGYSCTFTLNANMSVSF